MSAARLAEAVGSDAAGRVAGLVAPEATMADENKIISKTHGVAQACFIVCHARDLADSIRARRDEKIISNPF
jgi:hypothetical protein